MTPGPARATARLIGGQTSNRLPARSRRRAAREAIAFGSALIFIAMVGMTAAVETVKPEWRDPEFGHRLVRLRELESESPDRPLVLILGTSRTQNAFDPSAMGFADEPGAPRVFNFGQSAAPPLKVLLTLLRILDEGIRPSAVIVEVLPMWLGADGSAEDQLRERDAATVGRRPAPARAVLREPGRSSLALARGARRAVVIRSASCS